MTSQFPGVVKNPADDRSAVFVTTEEKVSRATNDAPAGAGAAVRQMPCRACSPP